MSQDFLTQLLKKENEVTSESALSCHICLECRRVFFQPSTEEDDSDTSEEDDDERFPGLRILSFRLFLSTEVGYFADRLDARLTAAIAFMGYELPWHPAAALYIASHVFNDIRSLNDILRVTNASPRRIDEAYQGIQYHRQSLRLSANLPVNADTRNMDGFLALLPPPDFLIEGETRLDVTHNKGIGQDTDADTEDKGEIGDVHKDDKSEDEDDDDGKDDTDEDDGTHNFIPHLPKRLREFCRRSCYELYFPEYALKICLMIAQMIRLDLRETTSFRVVAAVSTFMTCRMIDDSRSIEVVSGPVGENAEHVKDAYDFLYPNRAKYVDLEMLGLITGVDICRDLQAAPPLSAPVA